MLEFKDYIGNEYVRGFLQGAVRKGFDPYPILKTAGIPEEAYDDPEARIDGMQLHSLIQAVQEATNDIYLGFLEYPTQPPMGTEVAKIGLGSETLGEALKSASAFVEFYRNDFNYGYTLIPKTHEVCLGVNFKCVKGLDRHILDFYRLSNSYRFFCWLISQRIKLIRVCFPGPKPDYCYDYRTLFHCDIQFNQPECQFCFDKKYLNIPIDRMESEITDLALKRDDWLGIPGDERSLTSQIEQVLLELQKQNCASPSINAVADIVSLHPRTLRRMLARENETFQKIKTRLRRDFAIKLLLDTQIPVATIAERVGFAEPGDFTHAFVRWTGLTPTDYRATQGRSHAGR